MSEPPDEAPNVRRMLPWFVAFTGLAFSPALFGGFLNWDDPWLLQDNPYLRPDTWGALGPIWTDLSRETRLVLGAEYLPIRDTSWWLQTRLFGVWAPGLHFVQWMLYLGAVVFMRGALLRTFGRERWVELVALAFAVHPAHAESVAWLAGHKDVLALLFLSAALYVHAGESRGRALTVPLLIACASLSKSMSIAVLPLLVVQDFAARRRFQWAVYAAGLVAVVVTMAAHLHVGGIVHMVAEHAGGSRATAAMTMGPVWLRYLALAVYPTELSLVQDVPVLTAWTPGAIAGYAALLLWAGVGLAMLKRGHRLALVAFAWFIVPLGPVSQVLVPLQNRMADRYLWLSVMGPLLLIAFAWARLHERREELGRALAVLLVLFFGAVAGWRSALFTDSALVFAHATEQTRLDDEAPYQLGQAHEAEERWEAAARAYTEARRRAPEGSEHRRRATNNLARAYYRSGRVLDAERTLRAGLEDWPDDPRIRNNLAQVLEDLGRVDEARAIRGAQTP